MLNADKLRSAIAESGNIVFLEGLAYRQRAASLISGATMEYMTQYGDLAIRLRYCLAMTFS